MIFYVSNHQYLENLSFFPSNESVRQFDQRKYKLPTKVNLETINYTFNYFFKIS